MAKKTWSKITLMEESGCIKLFQFIQFSSHKMFVQLPTAKVYSCQKFEIYQQQKIFREFAF